MQGTSGRPFGADYDSSAANDDSSRFGFAQIAPGAQSAPSPARRIAMRFFLMLLLAAPVAASAQTYYLDVHNTAPSSLVAFAVAPAGSPEFREIASAEFPVRGGGDTFTIALDGRDGCLRDVRAKFLDGRELDLTGFNVCKYRFETGRYWRAARIESRIVAQP
jgi:hypothetical protein